MIEISISIPMWFYFVLAPCIVSITIMSIWKKWTAGNLLKVQIRLAERKEGDLKT